MEVARPDAKVGRTGRSSPWEVQERAVDGNLRARDLWAEYGQATRRRHRVRWSTGMREHLGLAVRTDEQLVHDDGEADELDDLDDDETALLLYAPEVTPHVCQAAEDGGAPAAHAFLATLLAVLTSLERAELRRWARDRVGLAGKRSPVRRQGGARPPRPGPDLRREVRSVATAWSLGVTPRREEG